MSARKPEKAIAKALSDLARETDMIKRVRVARALYEAAHALELSVVLEARSNGVTWSDIGREFDMTKQAAQQRFRKG